MNSSNSNETLVFLTPVDFEDSPAAKATVAFTVLLVLGFGGYVVWYIDFFNKQVKDNEEFVTAKNSVGMWKIGWSFYASGIGSWVITAPADLAFYSGLISVFMYGIAVGIPPLFIAYFGPMIQNRYPTILSLSDFVNFRYGRATQLLVVLVSLFNMSVAATAEYTTIAAFFSGYVGLGDDDVAIVLLVGFVTLGYTTYGGLPVSIFTDQFQAAASVLLVSIVAIYILATMDDLQDASILDGICLVGNTSAGQECSVTFADQFYGTTEGGYSTIFTLPLSLICATIFSEAFWQRAWAAKEGVVLRGAVIAAVALFTITAIFGLIGVYAGWNFLTGFESDPNLRVFQALEGESGKTIVSSGWGVVLILLAVIMSQSALDSLQNGIGASVNGVVSRFLKDSETNDNIALNTSRAITALLNIPIIFVGLQKYQILSLFLVSNMVTACATFPLVIGFFKHPFLDAYHNDLVPLTSFLIAILCSIGYGKDQSGGSFADGARLAFWEHFYEWDFFLVAFMTSILANIVLVLIIFVVYKLTGAEPRQIPDIQAESLNEKDKSIVIEETIEAKP